MRIPSLLWIFDSKAEPPEELGLFAASFIRWAVVTGLLAAIGVLSVLVAAFFSGDDSKAFEFVCYVRAVFCLLLAGWIVYATYGKFANKNKRKHEEQAALYREIAAYYGERQVKDGENENVRK